MTKGLSTILKFIADATWTDATSMELWNDDYKVSWMTTIDSYSKCFNHRLVVIDIREDVAVEFYGFGHNDDADLKKTISVLLTAQNDAHSNDRKRKANAKAKYMALTGQ